MNALSTIINLDECLHWLKSGTFKKISLQFPDHLMVYSSTIALHLQKCANVFTYIISDTSYDNCCSDQFIVDHIEVDGCIHFGHACLTCNSSIPTFYVFPKQSLDANIFCEEFCNYFQDETKEILLFYDISFAYAIESIYTLLKRKYRNLLLSTLNCTSDATFIKTPVNDCCDALLGRYYKLPVDHQIDTYDAVFLGSNDKTLVTLSISISVSQWHLFDGLKLFKYNPFNSMWLKKRNFLIDKIKDAESFGIIIASMNIKDYLNIIEMLKMILKKVNKKTYLFNVGKINPSKLANFHEVDIFVVVTCPESSLLDSRDYFKPIVTPFEVELAFNSSRTFSLPYAIDFKEMLPGGLNHQKFEINTATDMSLTSGKIRCFNSNYKKNNSVLAKTSLGTIMDNLINSDSQHSRTWNGLQQNLGRNSVSLAVNGRDGIPVNYENELL